MLSAFKHVNMSVKCVYVFTLWPRLTYFKKHNKYDYCHNTLLHVCVCRCHIHRNISAFLLHLQVWTVSETVTEWKSVDDMVFFSVWMTSCQFSIIKVVVITFAWSLITMTVTSISYYRLLRCMNTCCRRQSMLMVVLKLFSNIT